jgi:hypothetical protein
MPLIDPADRALGQTLADADTGPASDRPELSLALGSGRGYDVPVEAGLDTRIQQLHIVIELWIAR